MLFDHWKPHRIYATFGFMCGRFTLDPSKISLKDFGVTRTHYQPPARWNIAPTTGIAVVRQEEDGERELVKMRWGLLPSWPSLIRNSRS